MNELLGPLLHLIGLTGLVVAAYFKFRGDVQAQFSELGGRIDRVRDSVDATNQRLDFLWNREHERLRLKVEELEERLRQVEQKRVA